MPHALRKAAASKDAAHGSDRRVEVRAEPDAWVLQESFIDDGLRGGKDAYQFCAISGRGAAFQGGPERVAMAD